jgi:hypothetical protein
MRALPTMLTAFALSATLAACERASEEACEAACLHYSKLGLAEEGGLELGSGEHEAEWAARQEREELREGLGHCVQMCEGHASTGQTECILEAKSLAEADDCSGVSRARSVED